MDCCCWYSSIYWLIEGKLVEELNYHVQSGQSGVESHQQNTIELETLAHITDQDNDPP